MNKNTKAKLAECLAKFPDQAVFAAAWRDVVAKSIDQLTEEELTLVVSVFEAAASPQFRPKKAK